MIYVASWHSSLHLRVGGAGGRQAGQPPHPSPFTPGAESELQIALIALFSEMLYRFPNMVVAQVTRESVQQAIASGITAQQVSLLGEEVGKGAVLALGGGGAKVFLSWKHRSVRGGGESPGYLGRQEGRPSSCESASLHCSQMLYLCEPYSAPSQEVAVRLIGVLED